MKNYRYIKTGIFFLAFLLLSCSKANGPVVIPGENPGGGGTDKFIRQTLTSSYVEFRTGNYPLIITVPHGGSQTDGSLTVRTTSNCPDPEFSTVYDTYTPELAEMIDSVVFARTGKYPYVIFCRLKRTYIDMNRPIDYAIPRGNAAAKNIYDKFYNYIDQSKNQIYAKYGSGLLLDIHAHGHDKQEVEIGYQLSTSQLNLSDTEIDNNNLASQSGIYNLYKTVSAKQSFSQILRGDNSFGTLLQTNGIACIPNKSNPSPGTSAYFSGGYITKSSGSGTGGTIDAIQLEFNRDSRNDPKVRKNTAEQLIIATEIFFNLNYVFKQ
jgi:N-formylglutamate amidohydrolase